MLVLELNAADAEALAATLEAQGHAPELVREERYFGDAQSVTIMVETSTAVVNLVAATLALWSAKRSISASVGGNIVTIENANPAEVTQILETNS